MKQIFTLTLMCIGMVFLTSCDWIKTKKEENATKPLVINVLDAEQFNDAHIAGSINVPYEKLQDWASANPQYKARKVVVYCANYMCTASAEAAKLLKSAGFTDVAAYEGGIVEWKHLGFPIEGEAKQEYLQQPFEQPALEESQSKDFAIITAQELKNLL